MNKNLFNLFVLFLGTLCLGQRYLSDEFVAKKSKDALGNLSFVSFKQSSKLPLSNAEVILKDVLGLDNNNQLIKINSKIDVFGAQHDTYKQFVGDVEVKYNSYKVHSKNGFITSINGSMNNVVVLGQLGQIKSADEILNIGLAHLGINYQVDARELPENLVNQELQGKLYILPKSLTKSEDRYVYQFKLISKNPTNLEDVYMDANTGEILFKDAILKFHSSNTKVFNEEQTAYLKQIEEKNRSTQGISLVLDQGIAETRYSGKREIETVTNVGGYMLQDDNRFLKTLDLSEDYFVVAIVLAFGGTPTDVEELAAIYLDEDNNWTSEEYAATKDDGALEAHWSFSQTYDFFKEEYDRNGFDDENSPVTSFIHTSFFGTPSNAAWMSLTDFGYQGGFMFIGDGDYNPNTGTGMFDILASLDVIAHEFSHGVDSASGNLVYEREPGALDEGFADIWAAVVEANRAPEKQRWVIGEDFVKTNPAGIRSHSNPKIFNQPDTYLGQYWVDATPEGCPMPDSANDNCGVHTNSGVLNHWFYLLTDGGTGTNDNNFEYSVNGIGIKKSADLVYSVQESYVESQTNFSDLKDYTLQEAAVLYGENSEEVISVKDAWCAVGVLVGEECERLSVKDFTANTFSIYPNPVVDVINVSNNKEAAVDYKIVNTAGQLVMQGKVENDKINVGSLPKGVYVITLMGKESKQSHKFVKK